MTQGLNQILPPGRGEGTLSFIFKKKGEENEQGFRELLHQEGPFPESNSHQKFIIPCSSSCEQKKGKGHLPKEKRNEKESSSPIQPEMNAGKEIQKVRKTESEKSCSSSKDYDKKEFKKEEPEDFSGIRPEQKIDEIVIKEIEETENFSETLKARIKTDPHQAFEDFKKESLQRNAAIQFERSLIPEDGQELSCEETLALMEQEIEGVPSLLRTERRPSVREESSLSQMPPVLAERKEEQASADFSDFLAEKEEALAKNPDVKKASQEESGEFDSEKDMAQGFQEISSNPDIPSEKSPIFAKAVADQTENLWDQKNITSASLEFFKEIRPTQGVTFQIKEKPPAGIDRIEIQLRPEHLGKLNVRLEISHDGHVQTVIKIEKIETYDLMRQDRLLQQDLVNALKDSGFETDGGAMSFEYQEQKNNSREEEEILKVSGFNTVKEEEEEASLKASYPLRHVDPAKLIDSYI